MHSFVYVYMEPMLVTVQSSSTKSADQSRRRKIFPGITIVSLFQTMDQDLVEQHIKSHSLRTHYRQHTHQMQVHRTTNTANTSRAFHSLSGREEPR